MSPVTSMRLFFFQRAKVLSALPKLLVWLTVLAAQCFGRTQVQEYVEAATFLHYCRCGQLLSPKALNESLGGVLDAAGEPFFILTSDYLGGVSSTCSPVTEACSLRDRICQWGRPYPVSPQCCRRGLRVDETLTMPIGPLELSALIKDTVDWSKGPSHGSPDSLSPWLPSLCPAQVGDLTGEVMRLAINSVAAGKSDVAVSAAAFVRAVHQGFCQLAEARELEREVRKKREVMQQSLEKIEHGMSAALPHLLLPGAGEPLQLL